jgi:glycosyltransferase involved in cell wall biosynthesis
MESIKEADEIVIIDTGSKDNTAQICKQYTDKVYSYTGCNDEDGHLKDFSDARNHSMNRCKSDWIMIIDADEILKDSIKGIKTFLDSKTFRSKEKDGFYTYLGASMTVKTSTEELQSLRLVRNNPNIRYIYPFHNQLAFNGNTGILRMRSYKSTFKIDSGYSAAHFIDPDRTIRMIHHHLKDHPDDPRSLYYQGREYLVRHIRCTEDEKRKMIWLDKTIESFEKMDKSAFVRPWTNEYADGLFTLANCYIDKMYYANNIVYWYHAVAVLSKCVLVLPTFQAPMLLLAQLLAKTPSNMPHKHGVRFWTECAQKATNEDVAFLREVPRILKKVS